MLIYIKPSIKEEYKKFFRKDFAVVGFQVQLDVVLNFEAFNNPSQNVTEQIFCKHYETNKGILVAIVSIFSLRNVLKKKKTFPLINSNFDLRYLKYSNYSFIDLTTLNTSLTLPEVVTWIIQLRLEVNQFTQTDLVYNIYVGKNRERLTETLSSYDKWLNGFIFGLDCSVH